MPSSLLKASLQQLFVLNYAKIKHIEDPFTNPPRATAAPRTPFTLQHVEITTSNEDIQIRDKREARDEDKEPELPFIGRRRPKYAILTTVTLRKA